MVSVSAKTENVVSAAVSVTAVTVSIFNLTIFTRISITENLHQCWLAFCCYDDNVDIDTDVTVAITVLQMTSQGHFR